MENFRRYGPERYHRPVGLVRPPVSCAVRKRHGCADKLRGEAHVGCDVIAVARNGNYIVRWRHVCAEPDPLRREKPLGRAAFVGKSDAYVVSRPCAASTIAGAENDMMPSRRIADPVAGKAVARNRLEHSGPVDRDVRVVVKIAIELVVSGIKIHVALVHEVAEVRPARGKSGEFAHVVVSVRLVGHHRPRLDMPLVLAGALRH